MARLRAMQTPGRARKRKNPLVSDGRRTYRNPDVPGKLWDTVKVGRSKFRAIGRTPDGTMLWKGSGSTIYYMIQRPDGSPYPVPAAQQFSRLHSSIRKAIRAQQRGGNPPMLVIGNPRGKSKVSPDDPRWLLAGQKKIGAGAKATIEGHVDRLHVSVPEPEVEREVREVGVRGGAPEWYIRKAVEIALNRHRKNAALFGYVMRGGVGNPLTRGESAHLLKSAKYWLDEAKRSSPGHFRGVQAGRALGLSESVYYHGPTSAQGARERVESKAAREAYGTNPVSGPADPDAVTELVLYIENTYELVGAPNSQGMAITANLVRKWYAGKYDRERAVNLWMYLMESGARKYTMEFGTPGDPIDQIFNKNTRLEAARHFRDRFEQKIQGGEFDPAFVRAVVPKKYHGKLPAGNPEMVWLASTGRPQRRFPGIRRGGFEPDWSKYPLGASYYRTRLAGARRKGLINPAVRSPWAVCTAAVGRKDRRKYERCVRAVKARMKRGGNPALPPEIAHDPRFKKALRMYRRIHGGGSVEVRQVKVPKGMKYPKFLVSYGRAPHAVYDAPGSRSRRGKRIHHFGEGGGRQPWLVTAPERRKFLAFVGGSFRAGNWIYK